MNNQILLSIAEKIFQINFEEEFIKNYFSEFHSFLKPGKKYRIDFKINLEIVTAEKFRISKRELSKLEKSAYHRESGLSYFVKDESEIFILLRDAGISRIKGNKCRILINKESLNLKYIQDFLIQPAILELLRGKEIFFFHGGTLALKKTGLSISGRSGSGKSTLIYYLSQDSWKFLSDDITLFNRTGTILYPFINEIKIPCTSFRILNLKGKTRLGKKSFHFGESNLKTAVPGIFILLGRRMKKAGLSEVSGRALLEKLIESSIIPTLKKVDKKNFEALFKLVRNLKKCYILNASNNLEETRKILEDEIR